MKCVELRYYVSFGRGDSSDWLDCEIDLTDEEATFYDNAIENEIPLEDVAELQDALNRAYDEIEDIEIQNGIDIEDEYVLECQGLSLMDETELNELVANRNPHALAFLGLENASEEELEAWDAYDIDELPTLAEFHTGFEACSPYDKGWTLHVEFIDPNE